MSSNYKLYLDYLASFAESHNLADIAENSIYPLFSDIKRLINHYRDTIDKFETVQKDLTLFVDRIVFDENDFDYYQGKFQALREVDGYLQELKSKQISQQTAYEIQKFISDTYSIRLYILT